MLTNMRTIWAAILMSTFLVYFMGFRAAPNDLSAAPMTTLIALFAAAIASPLTGFFVVRMTYRNALRSLELKVSEQPSGGEPDAGYRGVSPSKRVITDADAAVRVLGMYQTATIIGVAMGEVPALMGLVSRTMGASAVVALAMTSIAWVAIGARFPTRKAAFGPVEEVYGAVMP
jgi:hypothetical protein